MNIRPSFSTSTSLTAEAPDAEGDMELTLGAGKALLGALTVNSCELTVYLNNDERVLLIEHLLRYTEMEGKSA